MNLTPTTSTAWPTDRLIEQFLVEIKRGEGSPSLDAAARWLVSGPHGWNELDVRADTFPRLGPPLRQSPPDAGTIGRVVAKDKGVFGGFGGSRARFADFFRHPEAPGLLAALSGDAGAPPDTDAIDGFIERAGAIAIRDRKGTPVRSEAALFTSALLTAAFPDGFVDYRHTRWQAFAGLYFLEFIDREGTYAEQLLEAAGIARAFAAMPAFQQYLLPAALAHRPEAQPLWVVASLTFHINDTHPAVPYIQKARACFSGYYNMREVRKTAGGRRGRGGPPVGSPARVVPPPPFPDALQEAR
jgi:hypothetical protein